MVGGRPKYDKVDDFRGKGCLYSRPMMTSFMNDC